jgi:hypothetical protein
LIGNRVRQVAYHDRSASKKLSFHSREKGSFRFYAKMFAMSAAPLELSKFVLSETIGSVLRFPMWWYSDGLLKLSRWIVRQIQYRLRAYSFVIWIQNLFVPMYGQYDWSGRLVSFVMRIVVLVGRGIGLFFEAFAYLVLIFAYVLVPPLALIMAVFSLTLTLPFFG